MMQTQRNASVAVRFALRGLVQGQGVRPMIARLAASHRVTGTVRNTSEGVEIEAMAEPSLIEDFRDSLATSIACRSLVSEVTNASREPIPSDFRIVESVSGHRLKTSIPVDLAVCSDCLSEVRSTNNRRYQYPFTTCTRCGPRFSILTQLPFDRDSTSMAAFSMCDQCLAEYRDPGDRRFHAQTIACPQCGPSCWTTDRVGNQLSSQDRALAFIAQQIANGKIAAIKGIGGYQLVCDATNEAAVKSLRDRKHRPNKPLPVMIGDINEVKRFALIQAAERNALQSPANPIVLLRAKEQTELAHSLSPKLSTIGIMLPTSPLHAMLVDLVGTPIVVTSGNVSGSPLIYKNDDATQIPADVLLHHDRDIQHPVDDSVVQCAGGATTTIRVARGIGPLTLPCSAETPMIAVGGHQKVAPALLSGDDLILFPHIGDMHEETSRIRFHESIQRIKQISQLTDCKLASDLHPDYFTHQFAETTHCDETIHCVQHHHAHVASAMLEHDLLDQTVLGLAFDGTGFGTDGTIWGGEALLATTASFQRSGHLRPFRLPGGEHAIKCPGRIADSLCFQLDAPPLTQSATRYAIEHGPSTTSMGRLFDGIAALTLNIETVSYEGEAAMRLESACELAEPASYEFQLTDDAPMQFDWRPMLREIQSDMQSLSSGQIAMKFHRAVAKLVIDLAKLSPQHSCVLTGGVFQNRVLLDLIEQLAVADHLDIRLPGKIPMNDGGLSVGQLLVAMKEMEPCA